MTYTATNGQSILDVCLNTYGTADYIYKLIQDSGYTDLDMIPTTGDVFVFDEKLVTVGNYSNTKILTKKTYATISEINLSDFDGLFSNDFN